MTRTAVVIWCLLVSAAGACQLGGPVEPTPLKGPTPHGIVVWPVLPEADVARDVFAGLDLAVRMRGYDVHSLAVGRQMLAEAGLLEGAEPDAARIKAEQAAFAASGDGH